MVFPYYHCLATIYYVKDVLPQSSSCHLNLHVGGSLAFRLQNNSWEQQRFHSQRKDIYFGSIKEMEITSSERRTSSLFFWGKWTCYHCFPFTPTNKIQGVVLFSPHQNYIFFLREEFFKRNMVGEAPTMILFEIIRTQIRIPSVLNLGGLLVHPLP
jgi:hypothetical protein